MLAMVSIHKFFTYFWFISMSLYPNIQSSQAGLLEHIQNIAPTNQQQILYLFPSPTRVQVFCLSFFSLDIFLIH